MLGEVCEFVNLLILFSIPLFSISYQKHFIFRWSKDDSDNLYWYYIQSCNSPDPVGTVLQLFAESGVTTLTRTAVNLKNT
jgi:hypothetical protein